MRQNRLRYRLYHTVNVMTLIPWFLSVSYWYNIILPQKRKNKQKRIYLLHVSPHSRDKIVILLSARKDIYIWLKTKANTVQSLIAFAKGRKLESYQREISLPLIADTHEVRSTEYVWRPIEGVFCSFSVRMTLKMTFLTMALWYRSKANGIRSMHGSWRAPNLYFSSLYFPSVYSIQQCP